MAYPFTQAIPFKVFRERLEKEFGCKFGEDSVKTNLEEKPIVIYFFKRTVAGKILRCSVSIKNESDMCQFSFVRYVCKSLKIPPAEFGLVLD